MIKTKKTKELTKGEIALATHHAKKLLDAREQANIRGEQKLLDQKRFIDPNFDYYNAIDEFFQDIEIIKNAKSQNEYMDILREWKIKYANSSYFYNIWGESIDDHLYEVHSEILEFLKKQLLIESNRNNNEIESNQYRTNLNNKKYSNQFSFSAEEMTILEMHKSGKKYPDIAKRLTKHEKKIERMVKEMRKKILMDKQIKLKNIKELTKYVLVN